MVSKLLCEQRVLYKRKTPVETGVGLPKLTAYEKFKFLVVMLPIVQA